MGAVDSVVDSNSSLEMGVVSRECLPAPENERAEDESEVGLSLLCMIDCPQGSSQPKL